MQILQQTLRSFWVLSIIEGSFLIFREFFRVSLIDHFFFCNLLITLRVRPVLTTLRRLDALALICFFVKQFLCLIKAFCTSVCCWHELIQLLITFDYVYPSDISDLVHCVVHPVFTVSKYTLISEGIRVRGHKRCWCADEIQGLLLFKVADRGLICKGPIPQNVSIWSRCHNWETRSIRSGHLHLLM